MNDMPVPTTLRTVTISRVLLSLAVAFLLGTMLAPDVDAGKNTGKKPTSVASRVEAQNTFCNAGGGTLTIEPSSSKTDAGDGASTDTSCKGGANDGWSCINRPGEEPRCWQARTTPDVPIQPLQPDGGGVTITAYDGDQHDEGKHYSKRKHHRRSERSR